MMQTETLEQRWNSYMTAFGAVAADERERLLEQSVAEDVVFTNPGAEGQSRAALMAHIEKFQQANPGAYFSTDKLYAQTDKLLAIWSMYRADGAKVATGYNFVRPDQDGRFSYMAGFF
jgi:hypothetical protein